MNINHKTHFSLTYSYLFTTLAEALLRTHQLSMNSQN